MKFPNLTKFMTQETRVLLLQEIETAKVVDDALTSAVTQFNRKEESVESDTGLTTDETFVLKAEISKALDRLDSAIENVLKDREKAEAAVGNWILVVGIVIVVLTLAAAVSPFFGQGKSVLPSVFTSLSVGGLVYLLFSPVQKRLRIADDRSNLVLSATTFRLRFATAQTPDELRELGRELGNVIRFSPNSENK
ncbi:MAG: hypothetical protein HQ483_09220 [Rhodospirillales bacterium]|nr:hypothetical protein [Rhodospirillales bacterium]